MRSMSIGLGDGKSGTVSSSRSRRPSRKANKSSGRRGNASLRWPDDAWCSATVRLTHSPEVTDPSGAPTLDNLMHCSLAMDEVHREDLDARSVVAALDGLHHIGVQRREKAVAGVGLRAGAVVSVLPDRPEVRS